jgi:hypothetical protein
MGIGDEFDRHVDLDQPVAISVTVFEFDEPSIDRRSNLAASCDPVVKSDECFKSGPQSRVRRLGLSADFWSFKIVYSSGSASRSFGLFALSFARMMSSNPAA